MSIESDTAQLASGRATLQDWVLKVHGTRSEPGRPIRSTTTSTTTTTTSTTTTWAPTVQSTPTLVFGASLGGQAASSSTSSLSWPSSARLALSPAPGDAVTIPAPITTSTGPASAEGTAAAAAPADGADSVGPRSGHDSVLRSKGTLFTHGLPRRRTASRPPVS